MPTSVLQSLPKPQRSRLLAARVLERTAGRRALPVSQSEAGSVVLPPLRRPYATRTGCYLRLRRSVTAAAASVSVKSRGHSFRPFRSSFVRRQLRRPDHFDCRLSPTKRRYHVPRSVRRLPAIQGSVRSAPGAHRRTPFSARDRAAPVRGRAPQVRNVPSAGTSPEFLTAKEHRSIDAAPPAPDAFLFGWRAACDSGCSRSAEHAGLRSIPRCAGLGRHRHRRHPHSAATGAMTFIEGTRPTGLSERCLSALQGPGQLRLVRCSSRTLWEATATSTGGERLRRRHHRARRTGDATSCERCRHPAQGLRMGDFTAVRQTLALLPPHHPTSFMVLYTPAGCGVPYRGSTRSGAGRPRHTPRPVDHRSPAEGDPAPPSRPVVPEPLASVAPACEITAPRRRPLPAGRRWLAGPCSRPCCCPHHFLSNR